MKQKCLKYKKQSGLELIYGAPTEGGAEKLRQGLAIPGGFKPKNEKAPAYKWRCSSCGHVWGKFAQE